MSNKGSIVRKLNKLNLIEGIKPFAVETHYEVIMGSFAYGVSSDMSDTDVYGVFIPPIDYIFPHTAGYIHGFGEKPPEYDTFQKHHIKVNEREYDIQLYTLVNYVQSCMENNPNLIDSLFVPERCVIHQSMVGEILRENRRLFLHKGIHKKLMGYAYSQLNKIRTKEPEGKRLAMIEKFGYDVKFAYHVVRLVQQAEMVMMHHDLDLEENRELLKSVRRGEWTLDELEAWFKKRRDELDTLYIDSDLRLTPDYDTIKRILMQCLEAHYGSLSAYFNMEGSDKVMSDKLAQIKAIVLDS
jgi:predicted nucleotidyltransferase